MMKRWLVYFIFFCTGWIQAAQEGVPNIVYILLDDWGWGDVQVHNFESKIPTPNLNRLASGGMMFTDAHAGASVCTPSRYSRMTGWYCWRGRFKREVLGGYASALIEKGRMALGSLLNLKTAVGRAEMRNIYVL